MLQFFLFFLLFFEKYTGDEKRKRGDKQQDTYCGHPLNHKWMLHIIKNLQIILFRGEICSGSIAEQKCAASKIKNQGQKKRCAG